MKFLQTISLITSAVCFFSACDSYIPNVTLPEAVKGGNQKAIQYHLKHGALVNQKDEDGNPLIVLAVEQNNPSVLKQLIEAGASVNARAANKMTPLMIASLNGNAEIVQILLDAKASVHEKTNREITIRLSELFENNKALDDFLSTGIKDEAALASNWTALELASLRGNTDVVKLLLKNGANAQETTDGLTLTIPTNQLDSAYVQFMNSRFQSIAAPPILKTWSTFFGFFSAYKHLGSYEPAVPWYENRRPPVPGNTTITAWERWPPLMLAAQFEHIETVKALLEAGADPSFQHKQEGIPLLQAASLDNVELLQTLLAHGADINQKIEDENTVLAFVSLFGTPKMAKAVLEAGADINATSSDGNTALFLASVSGRPEMVKTLLEAGADTTTKNKDGYTALRAAEVRRNTEVVKILMEMGTGPYERERSKMDQTTKLLSYISQSQQRKYLQRDKYTKLFQGLDLSPEGASGTYYDTDGSDGDGFRISLNSNEADLTQYEKGDVLAERRPAADSKLQYAYTLHRYYAGNGTACKGGVSTAGHQSEGAVTQGSALCADFCGIAHLDDGKWCCNDGSSAVHADRSKLGGTCKPPASLTQARKAGSKTTIAKKNKTAQAPRKETQPSRQTENSGPAESTGFIETSIENFPYPWYLTQVRDALGRSWERYRPKTGSKNLAATVSFDIKRDGQVATIELTRRSGDNEFDSTAKISVIDASPFPALPMEYEKDQLTVSIEFNN